MRLLQATTSRSGSGQSRPSCHNIHAVKTVRKLSVSSTRISYHSSRDGFSLPIQSLPWCFYRGITTAEATAIWQSILLKYQWIRGCSTCQMVQVPPYIMITVWWSRTARTAVIYLFSHSFFTAVLDAISYICLRYSLACSLLKKNSSSYLAC